MCFSRRLVSILLLIFIFVSMFSVTAFGASEEFDDSSSSISDVEQNLIEQYKEAMEEQGQQDDGDVNPDADSNISVIEDNNSDDVNDEFSGEINEVIDEDSKTLVAETNKKPSVIFIVMLSLHALITIGCIVYVLAITNKNKISKLWVLLPIFASFIGLIIFIIVIKNVNRFKENA